MPAQLKQLGIEEVDYVLVFNDTDRHFPAAAEVIKPQARSARSSKMRNPCRSNC